MFLIWEEYQMLKRFVCGGALVLLLGAAAPIASPSASASAISSLTQSRVVDQCFDDCVRICMQHTGGDQTACQFECMMTTCLAEVPLDETPLGMSRLPAVTRKE